MRPNALKVIIIAAAVAALMSFASESNALHSIFQTIDRNGDGKIEFSEFSSNMIEHAFNKIDDNDNQLITINEWELVENVNDRDKHDELFKQVNKENTRVISFEEFSEYAKIHSNIKETFKSLDKDSSGVLSSDELKTRPQFKMVTLQY